MQTADDKLEQLPNDSQAELTEVTLRKRRVLVMSLWLVGITFLTIFGLTNLRDGNITLCIILLSCAAVGLAYLGYMQTRPQESVGLTVPNLTLVMLSMVLLITGGSENTGLLWVYPITTIGVLINGYRGGIVFGASVLVLLGGALFLLPDSLMAERYTLTESTRFIFTLTALLAISLVGSYHTESAQHKMQSLHHNVKRLAYFDSLTGLANRSSFRMWLQRMLDRTERDGGGFALIYIDLDDFKLVNDRCGHQVGDRLLAEFGKRLGECVRPTDESLRMVTDEDVARLAGDEFIVTLPGVVVPEQAETVARRILAMFDGGFEVDGLKLPVTASVGIALVKDRVPSAETVLNNADTAMYRAKQRGKNRYEFFSDEIAQSIRERNRIEAGLRDALAREDFRLVYMPIYDSQSLGIVGCEALLRCDSPILPDVGPDQFIPVAESTGLIKAIDLWVVDNALATLTRLQDEHGYEGLMCINISSVEVHNTEFPEHIARLLEKHSVAPEKIELELTETSLAVTDTTSLENLKRLKDLGVSLSLDDFGTGYTAFNQLMSYPVNSLKIDRSFVSALSTNSRVHCKTVDVIQNLGRLYNLRVIAEGVESDYQAAYLRLIGCDWLQGYHLSKPLPYDELVELLGGYSATANPLGDPGRPSALLS